MKTLRWAWNMVANPPLVWESEDGSSGHTERVKRFGGELSRWDLRPLWFHTFATVRRSCGCRLRLGIKHTIYCSDHAGIKLGEGA